MDAIVTVKNKIANTRAYQEIADARKDAIDAIENAGLLIMEDINDANPAPHATVHAEAAAMITEFGPSAALQPPQEALTNASMDPTDPPLDQDYDSDREGEVLVNLTRYYPSTVFGPPGLMLMYPST